jgi:hypothetical protein
VGTQFSLGEKLFKCKTCSKLFGGSDYLTKHEKTHIKKVHCDVCNEQFFTKRELSAHKTNKHILKKCKHDNCIFRGKPSQLRIHRLTHYKKRKEWQKHKPIDFFCDKCGAEIKSSQGLIKHRLLHQKIETLNGQVQIDQEINIQPLVEQLRGVQNLGEVEASGVHPQVELEQSVPSWLEPKGLRWVGLGSKMFFISKVSSAWARKKRYLQASLGSGSRK